jgi:two-component system OmpR family sensor kinase
MRPPSALTTIGGFGVAVAMASVATVSAIVMLAPEPAAPLYSPWAAMTGLAYGGQGFTVESGGEPKGRRVPWIEQLFAIELRRAPGDVRVVWLDPPATGAPRVSPPAGTDNPLFTRMQLAKLERRDRKILLSQPQPPILAGLRESEGRWISARPDPPWLNEWRLKVLGILAVTLAFLTAAALLLARHLARPFQNLADALEYGEAALPVGGPRELRDAVAVIAETRASLESEIAERARILTAIAHDLRTPLTALRLRVETVEGPKRRRMIADIARMQDMLRDILEFTCAAAMPRERLAVRALVAEAVAEMPGANGRLRLLPGADAWVEVPPVGLRRAVENLLRNALYYAGEGDVELAAADGMVSISVRDHGPGIKCEDVDRLMGPFERGETSRNRATGGTGLGLSIVQSFAAQEGGSFTLSANPPGGTLATLHLPAAQTFILNIPRPSSGKHGPDSR